MIKKNNIKICILVLMLLLILFLSGCAILVGSPGEAKKVISVAASKHDNTIVLFSSRGPSRLGYQKPDITAPGNLIIAGRAADTNLGGDRDEEYGDYYTKISGTSMATPQVAGVSALLIQAYKKLYGTKPSAELIKTAILKGADDLYIDGLEYDPLHQGAGLINVEKSLNYILSQEPIMSSSPDKWFAKKLTTISERETNLGEPMYSIGLLPGDFVFQKFMLFSGQSLPSISLTGSSDWIKINQQSSVNLGDISENEQKEFDAYVIIPEGAVAGDYNEKINVYSDNQLLLEIPVIIKVAENLGDVTDELDFSQGKGYYYFSVPENAFLLEVNATTNDYDFELEHDCLNMYIYDPSSYIYDFEDYYYGDYSKSFEDNITNDWISLNNPSSGKYTLVLDNMLWDEDYDERIVRPEFKCDNINVDGSVKVYATKIEPLSISSTLIEGGNESFVINVENNGAELSSVSIIGFCGDIEKDYEAHSLDLVEGNLYDVHYGDFEEQGYIGEILFNVSDGTRKLGIDVAKTEDHPTVVNLYDPNGNLVMWGANSPKSPPETTHEVELPDVLNPMPGEWKVVVLNSDVYEDYNAGAVTVIVDIKKDIGLECDYLELGQVDFDSVGVGETKQFKITLLYPDSTRKGAVTILTDKRNFEVPLTIIPKKEAETESELKLSEDNWNYVWLDMPNNVIDTTLTITSPFLSSDFDLILSAEKTEDIGKINSRVLHKSFESYELENYNHVSGQSEKLELFQDSNGDGIIGIPKYKYGDSFYSSFDDDQDGFVDGVYSSGGHGWENYLESGEQNNVSFNQISFYVGDISPVEEYGIATMYSNGFMYYILFPKNSDDDEDVDRVYIDFDLNNNFTDETPLYEEDVFYINETKYKIKEININSWYEEDDDTGEETKVVYGVVRIYELKEIYVGDISSNYGYGAGKDHPFDGMYMVPFDNNNTIYFDFDGDFNFSNETGYQVGEEFSYGDNNYVVREITIYEYDDDDETGYIGYNRVEDAYVGNLSVVDNYIFTEDWFGDHYRMIIPVDENYNYDEPIYVDFDKDLNFSDETPLYLGDKISEELGYKIIFTDIDKGHMDNLTMEVCDRWGWCWEDYKYLYFGVEGTIKKEKYQGTEIRRLNISGEIYYLLDFYDYFYIDVNDDKDVLDAYEGQVWDGDVFSDKYGNKYLFDEDNNEVKKLEADNEYNLQLNPRQWKASLKAKSIRNDKGLEVVSDAISSQSEEIRIENSGNTELQLKIPIKSGDATIKLLGSNGSGGFDTIGGDDHHDEGLLTAVGTYPSAVWNESYEALVVSYSDGLSKGESYLVEVSKIDDTDGVTFKNSVTADKWENRKDGDFNVGNAVLTLSDINETYGTVTITAGDNTYFDRVISREGYTVFLPIESKELTGVTFINLSSNPTTWTLRVVEKAENYPVVEDREIIDITLGHANSKTSVVSVNGDWSSYDDADGNYEYVGIVDSNIETRVYYDTDPDQDTVRLEYVEASGEASDEVEFVVNVDDIQNVKSYNLVVQNLESVPPVVINTIYYNVKIENKDGIKNVDGLETDFTDEINIGHLIRDGVNNITISFLNQEGVATAYNTRVYVHEIEQYEANVDIALEHNLLPWSIELNLNKDVIGDASELEYTLSVENNKNDSLSVDCDLKIVDELGNTKSGKQLGFSVDSNTSKEKVGEFIDFPQKIGHHYVITKCKDLEEKTATDIKEFTITGDVNMNVILDKNVVGVNEVLNYKIILSKVVTEEITGDVEIIIGGKRIYKSNVEVPSVVEESVMLDQKPGEYDAEFKFIHSGKSFKVVKPIVILSQVMMEDIDGDGIPNHLDDDDDEDGIPDSQDRIRGNLSHIKGNVDNIRVKIGASSDLINTASTVQRVKIEDGNDTLVEFDYDFSNELALDEVKIEKEVSGDSKGKLLIKGINLSSGTKTVYLSRIKANDLICIKDVEIDSLDEISGGCNANGEFKITCDGTIQNGYNCSVLNNTYKITGLNHSGIVEYEVPPQPQQPASTPTPAGSGGTGGGRIQPRTHEVDYSGKEMTITLRYQDDIIIEKGGKEYLIEYRRVNRQNIKLIVEETTGVLFEIGETNPIDIDNDGIDDYDVTLERVTSSKIIFDFVKKTVVDRDEETKVDTKVEPIDDDQEVDTEMGYVSVTDEEEVEVEEESDWPYYVVGVVVLLIILFVLFAVIKKHKNKKVLSQMDQPKPMVPQTKPISRPIKQVVAPVKRFRYKESEKLAPIVKQLLGQGYDKVHIKVGFMRKGWPEKYIDDVLDNI